MIELTRALRHLLTPFTIWAVEKGWLPEVFQGDLVEFGVILGAFLVSYVWSMTRDGSKPSTDA